MEKAKFIIGKNKKNKLFGEILFEDGKKMPIPSHVLLNESYNDKECEVSRDSHGHIEKIVYEGKELFSKRLVDHKQSARTITSVYNEKVDFNKKQTGLHFFGKKNNQNYGPAKAPYNFIPLNMSVVEGEKVPNFNKYYVDEDKLTGYRRMTGYIDCRLETLTPLYIRDTNSNIEQEANENPDFFSPGGKLKIPGSSLRGMIRNLVEIASWSKFKFFDDKLLYYRGLADMSSLQKEYRDNMSSKDRRTGKSIYKFNAGYLIKDGLNYFIIPAILEDGKQFIQVKKRDKTEEFTVEKQTNGKYLVVSGKMPQKEHDWLLNPPDFGAERILIPRKDILFYVSDENKYKDDDKKPECARKDGDLLRLLKCSEEKMTPCFYVRWKDRKGEDRVTFGHTGYFRLAYKKSIGEHIPDYLKDESKLDMAEAIFGKELSHASRVFFEDAVLLPGQQDVLMPKKSPKILSGPKPTNFQHYLRQDGKELKTLNHWNSECYIRGHKLYWHRNNKDWYEKEIIKDKQHTIIKAVKPGTIFNFRIRFENLSKVELGALLFVLDLPENHYHKLGMGKPLGLGSIKITPSLFLIDRKKRYTRLFENNKWYLAIEEASMGEYKRDFEEYILGKMKEDERGDANCLWDVGRMKELREMLDWGNVSKKDWLDKTRYMEIGHIQNGKKENEFKYRRVLPKPSEVVKL